MDPEKIEQWLRAFSEAPVNAPRPRRQLPAAYRPPLDSATVAKMRHMRREGFTIGDIARAVRCSWRTALERTKGYSA